MSQGLKGKDTDYGRINYTATCGTGGNRRERVQVMMVMINMDE